MQTTATQTTKMIKIIAPPTAPPTAPSVMSATDLGDSDSSDALKNIIIHNYIISVAVF